MMPAGTAVVYYLCCVFKTSRFREFLTGFHKRKLAKAEAARKKATEREKQERLEARREVSCALSSTASTQQTTAATPRAARTSS
jgi:hypothetical protein